MTTPKALGLLTLFALAGTFYAESRIHSCDGVDEEWSQCPARTCEPDCKPINCKFGPWSKWTEGGGCTQIKFRERSIVTSNNECGQPCRGPKIESARSPQEQCAPAVKKDCKVGEWQDWTSCLESLSTRQRVVEQKPENDGFPCGVPTKQVVPCNQPKRIGCMLDEWADWSVCSVTCGLGVAERTRNILSPAENNGDACEDVLSEVGACHIKACPTQNCVFAAWLDWSACDVGASQQYRIRSVEQGSLGQGAPCVGDIKETMPCPTEPTNMCVISEWSHWSRCSKSCDVGQHHRTRIVVSSIVGEEAKNCRWDAGETGVTLHETSECNSKSCDAGDLHCKLSVWTSWGACSAKCGQGISVRQRTVETPALTGGLGCVGALQEVQDCEGSACEDSECKWGDWFPWSACTATCGRGTRIRNRVVIQSPSFGNVCEEFDKSEVAACQDQPCSNNCVDGEWGPWTDWTICSATCSEGFQKRTRVPVREANSCGQPLNGSAIDFQQCLNKVKCVPDRDCKLSQWGDWSACSASCYGLRERGRSVVTYASGNGKACDLRGLREAEPCNPGIHEPIMVDDKIYSQRLSGCGAILAPRNCSMSDWSAWSPCSRTCGGGQMTRARSIVTFPVGSGSKCEDDLESTVGCATESCNPIECIDCELSEWSDWSACSHCGGQRFRHKVVSVISNRCGTPCPLSPLKEVSNCTSVCSAKLSCAWSAWSDISSCNSALGGNAVRSRTLSFLRDYARDGSELFQSLESGLCTGNQAFATTCADPSCETSSPKDCIFSQWSDWGEASCLGVCARTRSVVQQGNRLGHSCEGTLKATKYCSPICKKNVDCVVGDWAEWTTCDIPHGQKSRARAINVYPVGLGRFCDKVLEETIPCIPDDREPCVMSDWGLWGQCSLSCGGGYQVRSRGVLRHASARGKQCDDSLEELQPCSTQPCQEVLASNCIYSNWSAAGLCVNGQRQYDRSIIHFASGSGHGCYEALSTLKPCTNSVQDCVISQWTDWDVCDHTCGEGQQTRHREIEQFPSKGGKACEGASGTLELYQARGCLSKECPDQDCLFSHWGDWSECSSTCSDDGLTTRTRSILRSRTGVGVGCEGNLSETAACDNLPPCQTHQSNCTWAKWSSWSACSCSCGGGQRSRVRDVATFPTLGGKFCDSMVKEELGNCNTQSCEHAVDGVWDSWSEWTGCSSSCQSGTRFRHRVVGIMANAFGNPPDGDSFETEFCNANVSCVQAIDCKFSKWSLWSDCSTACDGTKERSRNILQYSRGIGNHCAGALEELVPCNPGLDEARPEGCHAPTRIDCELSQWTDWSSCSATCGGGQTFRQRGILFHASGGGKPCSNDTKEVNVCSAQTCPTHAVDCEIGEWTSWSPCNKCSGQKERTRLLKQEAKFGGRQCNLTELKDTAPCPFTCGEVGFCVWKDWGDWSSCDNACGPNRKTMRMRRLVFSNASVEGTRLVSVSSLQLPTAKPTNAPKITPKPTQSEGDKHHLEASPQLGHGTEGDKHHLKASPQLGNGTEGDKHHLRATPRGDKHNQRHKATPRLGNATEGKDEIVVDKESISTNGLAEDYVPLDWKVKTLAFSSGGCMILLIFAVVCRLQSTSLQRTGFMALREEQPRRETSASPGIGSSPAE